MPEEKSDHDRLVEIHTVLLGTDGHSGIAKQVERNTRNINKLWIATAVIASSVGGGIWGILQALL